MLEEEPIAYLTKFIQGLLACCVLCVGGRALDVSGIYFYTRAGGMLCTLC